MLRQRIETALTKYSANKPPHFAAMYSQIMSQTPRRILEIGIHEGGSLMAWRDLFPAAEIVGLDRRNVDVGGCATIQGDQCDVTLLRQIGAEYGPFDVVIDDGGHRQHQQRLSHSILWGFVLPGGWYVIEDLHTGRLGDKYNPTQEQTTLERWLENVRTRADGPHDQIEAIMFSGRSVAIWKTP